MFAVCCTVQHESSDKSKTWADTVSTSLSVEVNAVDVQKHCSCPGPAMLSAIECFVLEYTAEICNRFSEAFALSTSWLLWNL